MAGSGAGAAACGGFAASMVTVATVLIDLLGRIVGEDMAIHLVNQVGTPSPRGVVSSYPEEA